jgi:hypothetical protein
MMVLGLGGWGASWTRGAVSRGDAVSDVRPGIRVDVHSRVFNGQDLQLASFLKVVVAPGHPEYAALIHAGANVAQALAWALAPSGATETWRLDELARRRGPGLATSDDPEILRDRDNADRRFRDALRVILPETEFFQLYLERLTPGAQAILGRPAAARLARMAGTGVLSGNEVDFLLGPEGPERALLAIRPLAAFRRYTYYRYLSVWELFQALGPGPGDVDVVVPTVAAFDGRLSPRATPTPQGDQLLAMARLVTLCGGRLHPLAPFDQRRPADARDSLALVQDAVEHGGFVGVTLSAPLGEGSASEDRSLHALLAWCAREEVAVVAPGAHGRETRAGSGVRAGPEVWSRLLARYPGLQLGVRGLAGDIPEGSPSRRSELMYGSDWLRRSIEGEARDVLQHGDPVSHRLDEGGTAQAILGDNAATFLGLRKGRRTRERLERFYDRQRMGEPAWMRALDEPGIGRGPRTSEQSAV